MTRDPRTEGDCLATLDTDGIEEEVPPMPPFWGHPGWCHRTDQSARFGWLLEEAFRAVQMALRVPWSTSNLS